MPRTSTPGPSAQATRWCDCTKHCEGGKNVSLATYNRHKTFRLSQGFQDFARRASELEQAASATIAGHSTQAGLHSTPILNRMVQKKRKRRQPVSGSSSTAQDTAQVSGTTIPRPVDTEEQAIDARSFEPTPSPHPPIPSSPPRIPSEPPAREEIPAIFPPGQITGGGEDEDEEPNLNPISELDDLLPTQTDAPPPSLLHPSTQRPTAHASLSMIEDIALAQKYIHLIQNASLDNDGLDQATLESLRNPVRDSDMPSISPDLKLAIRVYLSTRNASDESYSDIREAIQERFPDVSIDSGKKMTSTLSGLSGVVADYYDMCVNGCIGFTGPLACLDRCPTCQEARYDQLTLESSQGKIMKPRLQYAMPRLGPQLQARRAAYESAKDLQEHEAKINHIRGHYERTGALPLLEEISDILDGNDIREAIIRGEISPTDSLLFYTMDGCQLYRNKQSDCWIQIWLLFNLSPQKCYKKMFIIPGMFIPGPKKPKNLDTFIFPALHHLAALQREGLRCWDAYKQAMTIDRPFLVFAGADTPAMAMLDGLVGHHGRVGCRLYCAMLGRRKAGASQYFPVALKPGEGYSVLNSDHEDVDIKLLAASSVEVASRYQENLRVVVASANQASYKKNRLATGISKPTLFSGLPRTLGIPGCFPADFMHLPALNIPDLLLALWRGTLECDINDNRNTWTWAVLRDPIAWKRHGFLVGAASRYLPGSFDRPPRDPSEKLNSGYKAWEFLTYVYGYCPALLHGKLPHLYWRNFCKLVMGIRVHHQHVIKVTRLRDAHQLLIEFVLEFEVHYYQRKPSRIHFVRPSIHLVTHAAPETIRVGPLGLCAQWGIERTIGDLGREVRQPSNPYQNLAMRGIQRACINALHARYPELNLVQPAKLPRGSQDLGNAYILLRKRDKTSVKVPAAQEAAICAALVRNLGWVPEQLERSWDKKIVRWARLALPNAQIARSRYCEVENSRISRIVKIQRPGKDVEFGEVQYYFRFATPETPENPSDVRTMAVAYMFGSPDARMLQDSCGTVWAMAYKGSAEIAIVDVKAIQSAVSMVPFSRDSEFMAAPEFQDIPPGAGLGEEGPYDQPAFVEGWMYFLVERLGLEIVNLPGGEDDEEEASV